MSPSGAPRATKRRIRSGVKCGCSTIVEPWLRISARCSVREVRGARVAEQDQRLLLRPERRRVDLHRRGLAGSARRRARGAGAAAPPAAARGATSTRASGARRWRAGCGRGSSPSARRRPARYSVEPNASSAMNSCGRSRVEAVLDLLRADALVHLPALGQQREARASARSRSCPSPAGRSGRGSGARAGRRRRDATPASGRTRRASSRVAVDVERRALERVGVGRRGVEREQRRHLQPQLGQASDRVEQLRARRRRRRRGPARFANVTTRPEARRRSGGLGGAVLAQPHAADAARAARACAREPSGSSLTNSRTPSAEPSQRAGSTPASASSTSSHRRSNCSQPSWSNAAMPKCAWLGAIETNHGGFRASGCSAALRPGSMRAVVLFVAVLSPVRSPRRRPPPRRVPARRAVRRLTVPLDHTGATPGTLSVAYAQAPGHGHAHRHARAAERRPRPGGDAADRPTSPSCSSRCARPTTSSPSTSAARATPARSTATSRAVDASLRRAARRPARVPEHAGDRARPRGPAGRARRRQAHAVRRLLRGEGRERVRAPLPGRGPRRVILDSPTPVDGLDGVGRAARRSARPRVLQRGLLPRPLPADGDRRPTRRSPRPSSGCRTAPLRGPLVSADRARADRARRRESDLYSVLIALSDLNPRLRAGLPAAIASLAAGDAAPLLHLVAGARRAAAAAATASRRSRGCWPRRCIEARLPWTPDSAVATRADALKAFIAERTDGFAPFRPETVLGDSIAELCATWPPTPRPSRVALRRARTCPVLVLVRPRGPAHAAGGRAPHARRSTRTPSCSPCRARRPLGAELRLHRLRARRAARVPARRHGRSTARSARGPQPARRPRPYAPATIAGPARRPALGGLRGRTLSARRASRSPASASTPRRPRPRETLPAPGPAARATCAARGATLELHGVEWIRGVRVSGHARARGRGTRDRHRLAGRRGHGHASRRTGATRDARRAVVHARELGRSSVRVRSRYSRM